LEPVEVKRGYMLGHLAKTQRLQGETVVDTDNQQETIQAIELAWLAGVLDCDGSVQMTVPKSPKAKHHRRINVWIDFSNSDAAIINKVIDVLDRLGIGHYDGNKFIKPVYKQDGTFYKSETKICMFCRISKLKSIERLLSVISPYLVGQKKHFTEIILRFVRKRLKTGRKPYEEDDILIVKEFFQSRNGRFAAKNAEMLDRILNDCTPRAAQQ
jgi:hypothetical protein